MNCIFPITTPLKQENTKIPILPLCMFAVMDISKCHRGRNDDLNLVVAMCELYHAYYNEVIDLPHVESYLLHVTSK